MCKIGLRINYNSGSAIKTAKGFYRKQGETTLIEFPIDDITTPSLPDIAVNGNYELVRIVLDNESGQQDEWTGVMAFSITECETPLSITSVEFSGSSECCNPAQTM